MKRIIISSMAALALTAAGLSASEPAALAAQKKRPCACKQTVARRSRPALSRAARARVAPASYSTGGGAAVVGPVFATYTLEENQYFRLRMNQTITSEKSRLGDRFKATVVTPVYADGVEVVPAGSIIEGRVTRSTPARSRGREGEIGVAFDTLVVPDGKKYQIDGALTELQDEDHGEVDAENEVSGRSSDKRKVTYVGGGAAGGAILGGIIGGGKGAGIGAAVGAGAGVAGILFTKGNEAQLRSGTELGMTTTRPIKFTVRSNR
jgi:type IV secretion system protein VirB10